MTVPIVLALIGGVALLIGLFGGGVKAKEIEIPKIPGWSRLFSAVFGIILLGVSVWLYSSPPSGGIATLTALVPNQPTDIPAPVEINFEASKTSINDGNCSVLKWNVQNAMHVYLNGTEMGGRGDEEVCPRSTTTYTLGVEHATGYFEREITVIVEDAPLTGENNIPFTYADDFRSGITIHAVRAKNTGTTIEFQFDYTSDVERGVSFFDPPNGETISIQEILPAGTNTVMIAADISALQSVSSITVNFYIPSKELTGRIFLEFEEIEKILP
ncbi:MAG TPA: hypothetical protein VIS72_13920 [Anaerolineales bacterium]